MNVIRRLLTVRPKGDDILEQWSQLMEGMRFSSQEFYQRVEAALRTREVPELQVTRVDFKEGGRLSPWRAYLRCRRERLYFDICAMPFGTGFYVSEWCWERAHRLGLAALLIALAIVFGVCTVLTGPNNEVYFYLWRNYHMPPQQTTLLLLGVPAAAAVLIALWLGDRLDEALVRVPLIGWFYEHFIRRLTYYRADRRSAYMAAVHAALCDVIDDICQSQGIAPLSELARRPAHRDLAARINGSRRRGRDRADGNGGAAGVAGGDSNKRDGALEPVS